MGYETTKTVDSNFEETIKNVTSELNKEGFGIITEIDLKSKFKEKLNKDFRNYKILGACNPKLAYDAIQTENRIGVMLPCNVVVQEHEGGKVEVSAINPLESIGVVGNDELNSLASEVGEKLRSVLQKI